MRTDTHKNGFASNMLVTLKDENWLKHQRVAGKIAADVLVALEQQVNQKTTKSLIELNEFAEKMITDAGGACTFRGYHDFPAGVCISVNKQLVHGIPTDYKLQDWDVVSFDLGVTIEGAIADTAITCVYGGIENTPHVSHHQVIVTTQGALQMGIRAINIGKRLGRIGEAIYKISRGPGHFACVDKYGGHGLDWNTPHSSPFVANRSTDNEGIRIQPGLSIAIEPMFVLGSSAETHTASDGWTVYSRDISAHFEHSVFVHRDRVEVITHRDGEIFPREIFFKVLCEEKV
jgi:methionyl aminopeptidase